MDNPNKANHPSVETYAEDMAKVIGGDQGGLIRKIIHEEEEKELQKNSESPESRKNKIYLYLGVVLIVLALATVLFFLLRKKNDTVAVIEPAKELIFNDKTFFIEIAGLTKEQIAASVASEVNGSNIKIGGVEGIHLTENKRVIGLRRFLELIKANFVPGDAALVSDSFLLGIANNNTKDFFILLKSRSSLDIFNPLRAWEDKMFADLHGFFGLELNQSTGYLAALDFKDDIIENKNARVLYDKGGDIELMYVYIDDNSVAIARTTAAIREVMLRLQSSQVKK
jgi:hypothetical protein